MLKFWPNVAPFSRRPPPYFPFGLSSFFLSPGLLPPPGHPPFMPRFGPDSYTTPLCRPSLPTHLFSPHQLPLVYVFLLRIDDLSGKLTFLSFTPAPSLSTPFGSLSSKDLSTLYVSFFILFLHTAVLYLPYSQGTRRTDFLFFLL